MSGPKTWTDRVQDAFTADPKFAEKYLELLYSMWQEVARNARRTAALLLALMLAFLVLIHARKAEVTLGPLRLTNVTTALTLIPAIVAFLFFELTAFIAAGEVYRRAVSAVISVLNPQILDEDLEIMLYPTQVHIWEESNWAYVRTKGPAGLAVKVNGILAHATGWGLLIGGGGFLVYAYLALYGNPHTNIVAVTASLAFAVVNTVRGGLEFLDAWEGARLP